MINPIDKVIEILSPKRGLERARNRMAINVIREYDAAKATRLSGGYRRHRTNAADEAARAHKALAGGAQDLVRNTALGNRIKSVIASNIVGDGIKPDYVGNKARIKRYKDAFDTWAKSTACDYEGHTNFYGLQWLWAATVAESGGVLIRRVMNNALAFPLVLQTLEQQYLDDTRTTPKRSGNDVISGIEYTDEGQVYGYWIHTRMIRGTRYRADIESKFYPAADIVHIYWKDRPGQHLGVSWYHPVSNLIDDRQEWRDTTLVQARTAACFGAIIEEAPKEMSLNNDKAPLRDEDGLPYSELEPGMLAYVGHGAKVHTLSPPALNNTSEFNSSVVEDIAVGVGVTREQLTGDFSKVTWASGRLARGEFYTNLDRWQIFMMIPALDKVHNWFDQIYTVQSGTVKATRNWVLPHRTAVNPMEELKVDIMKVRTCAMTPQQFSAKHGIKFEDALQGWKEAKAMFGDIPFDHDPSKYSAAGNQLDDNDAASSNKSDSKTTDTNADDKEEEPDK